MQQNHSIVSFDSDELIVVDAQDQVLGYQSKTLCHDGEGILHRAFSVFLFNDQGQVLMQQRSAQKRLWPMVWSNSCCSHPRRNESMLEAACRRTEEELAITMSNPLLYLFKFTYQARYAEAGSEHELCSVFVGSIDCDRINPNETEVNDWGFFDVETLDQQIGAEPEKFTPWMKLEWQRLRNEFWPQIKRHCLITAEPA
jgi:isopentenyl-diphosphate delta-isomerase